jgi:tetratricopeptide (TPR) repeat protein
MRPNITWLIILFLPFTPTRAQTPVSDSLARVQFVKKQTDKADSLTKTALNMAQPGAANQQLNQALAHIDNALHIYSRFRDTPGIRQSFDNLAFVYHLQKKHSQEKWYILQSNTLSRTICDTPGIINSLIKLAAVKRDIKDYSLAVQDLNEVAYLSQRIKDPDHHLIALQNLAEVYTKSGDLKNETIVLNRIDRFKDSIKLSTRQAIAANNGVNQADSIKNRPGKNEKSVINYTRLSMKNVILIALIISILITTYFIFNSGKKKR